MSYDGHEIIAIWLFDESEPAATQEAIRATLEGDEGRDAYWWTSRSFGFGVNHTTTTAQLLEVIDVEFASAEDEWDLDLDNFSEVLLLGADAVGEAIELLDELLEDPDEAVAQILKSASSDEDADELIERLVTFDLDGEAPSSDGERLTDFVAAFAAAMRVADQDGIAIALLRIETPG